MLHKTYIPLSVLLLTLIALPGCWNTCEKKQEDARTETAQAGTSQEESKTETKKSHGGVHEVASLEQFNALLKEGKHVIADFFAPWCGPCKRMKPIFHALAEKYPDIIFVTVNNDESGTSEIFKKYGVNAFPTFVFFDKSGNEIKTQQGGASESDFEATIASTFNITVQP
jgi:thiol-disulfide isomerase/thioredoxin